ncbi:MAG: aquaporin, partial [Dongiaceae bacterium]
MSTVDLPRRLTAEALGTALLVAVVVGSGIMGERLAGGNDAIVLLGSTLATGAALVVLIVVFGPISGAHFNPVVSLVFAMRRELAWADMAAYLPAQILGGIAGTLLAHLMFDLPLVTPSDHARTGIGVWTGEIVA